MKLKFGRTRKAVETLARGPSAFLVLLNYHLCFYNSKERRYMFFISYWIAELAFNSVKSYILLELKNTYSNLRHLSGGTRFPKDTEKYQI